VRDVSERTALPIHEHCGYLPKPAHTGKSLHVQAIAHGRVIRTELSDCVACTDT
jgi:hypothetical protein